MRQPELSVLIGKTLTSVTNDNKEIVFCCSDGSEYKLFHNPGRICLEYTLARFGATIDDIDGDFDDLVGSPIIMAEEVSNDTSDERYRDEDRVRWTFYKFATVKGYVTVRWFGTSEYYSSSVEFAVLQILKNAGVDVTCGACAEVAFTGATFGTHTCLDSTKSASHERD